MEMNLKTLEYSGGQTRLGCYSLWGCEKVGHNSATEQQQTAINDQDYKYSLLIINRVIWGVRDKRHFQINFTKVYFTYNIKNLLELILFNLLTNLFTHIATTQSR